VSEGHQVTEQPSRTTAAVAYEALNLGKQNARDITQHEDVCADRYRDIKDAIKHVEDSFNKSTDEIKGILKWAGGILFSIILTLLGFLATQQFNANDQARKSAEIKIDMLERQINQARTPAPTAPVAPHP